MAGGIDWFRWHHGSVSDQKFILIARKSGASVAEVIAVWACLLEAASASEQRGNFGAVDYESMDCALGLDDGRTQAIHEAMVSRGLVSPDAEVNAWDKRQPKREDDSAAERKRKQREREAAEKAAAEANQALGQPVTSTESRSVTHESRDVTQCHDRGEERREEERREFKTKDSRPDKPASVLSVSDLVAEGADRQAAADWLTLRKAKRLPLTATAWADTKAEASKLGMTPGQAVAAAVSNNWAGFKASWLTDRGGSVRAPPMTKDDRDAAAMQLLGFSVDPMRHGNVIEG